MPETQITEQPVYQAKPTIRVDGQANDLVTRLTAAMEVSESDGGMSSLELRLTNVASYEDGSADTAFPNDQVLGFGKEIAVYGGDENAPFEIFRGRITGLEAEFPQGTPELVVLAEDALQQSRMQRRTKVRENVKLKDLAEAVAREIGLTAVVTGLRENIGTQVQLNESDLAFLRRLLARYDCDLQVVGAELHVSPRVDVHRGDLTLALSSQLRRVRLTADLAHQVSEVTVSGWNPKDGRPIKVRSVNNGLQPGAGKKGFQYLEQGFGKRSEHYTGLAVATNEEAQALADALFRSRARRFVVADASAEGNPRIRVGVWVTLSGLGRYDNTYYVTEAVHRYDQLRGYETDFRAECACFGDA